MAEFSNVATQTVAVNGNVLFTDAPTSICNKGYISHRTGSGLINLKGATNTCKAKYRVEFNGNIAVPTGGTAGAISLAIAVEGEPDLSTLAISTPTAVEAFLTLVALRLLFPTFINRSTCRKFKYHTDTALHYPRMPVYMHL